jgi:hypothetical protein
MAAQLSPPIPEPTTITSYESDGDDLDEKLSGGDVSFSTGESEVVTVIA